MEDRSVLVTGAGGFIGGHLVSRLLRMGLKVRAVDVKPLFEWQQRFDDADNLQADLSRLDACVAACEGVDQVYNLAAEVGGMGFITRHRALCMLSVLINTHLLVAARQSGVSRFFFASSACIYNTQKQDQPDAAPLKEPDAYPAFPEDGYGWEKLFSERMCRHFSEDFSLPTRVARLHNVYGPWGSWNDGKEKAPAALCRKVAQAQCSGSNEILIWGDGRQTRTFLYVDDCVDGIVRLMNSDCVEPVNLGSEELVSIDGMVDLLEDIASVRLERRHDLSQPQGVRGRNCDPGLAYARFGWRPSTPLRQGLQLTYDWIRQQVVSEAAPCAQANPQTGCAPMSSAPRSMC